MENANDIAHSKCDQTQHWLTKERPSFQFDEVKVPLLVLIKSLITHLCSSNYLKMAWM